MTNLFKIQWKIPIANPDTIDPWDFFRAFSSWIPESPEIFIDVVDYRHVHDGPKIALIGHYADFFLDDSDGELGLVYSQKRRRGANFDENLKFALTALKTAADRLTNDPFFDGKLVFLRNKFLFVANDRAAAPNDESTFERLSAPLSHALESVFLNREISLNFNSRQSHQRFSVYVHVK
jgi:hypothetical protein